MGPRFVYEGGPSENPFSETEGSKIEAAKKAETVTEYKSDTDKTYYDGIIKGKVDSKKTELEGMLDAKLAAIKDDDPNKDKLKSDIEAEKKKIPEKLKQYKKELETARDTSLGKIESAVKARNAEIKEEATKYRQSIVLEMEAHDVELRQNHPNKEDEGNWDTVKASVKKNFQFHQSAPLNDDSHFAKGMQMQQHVEGKAAGGSTNWTRTDQLDFLTETVQTTYEEQGKEAADALVEKIKKQRLENGGDKRQINWFVYDASFQPDEKSNVKDMSMFKHVTERMGAPVDKPKAVGHILGKMASADKYFSEKHNAPGAFKAYQAYVQEKMGDADFMDKLNKGTNDQDILSPAQWLKEHGDSEQLKEVLHGAEKDRSNFIDTVLGKIQFNEEIDDPSRLAMIRSALEGAMWASNDPSEWDRIAQRTLAKMMGGNFDSAKMNVNDLDISKYIMDHSSAYGDETLRYMVGGKGLAMIAGLMEGADQMYGKKDPEFLKKYKAMINDKLGRDSELMKRIRDEVQLAGGGKALMGDLEAQERIRKLIDANIRAAYNYKSDLEKAQKKQEQKEEEKKPKVDEQLEKDKADTSKVLLVMTDHTASRTSPTQYRQAVSMKAAYEKAEDKKAWLESNKEELDSLKKRMPKVLGWEKGLGIERKDSGEVEKDPTNAKPSQAPAGQPSGAPKEGGGDKGLEAFAKDPIDVAKAEAAERGDHLKKEDVPQKVQEKVKDQDPGFYSVTYKEDGAEKKVIVEVKKEEDKKKEDFFAPKKTA
ncbi:MAG: hypothetical protein R3B71_05230 [Candidatus Gracilibacteria bacterium]